MVSGRGIIAVGQFAYGVITVAQFGVGLLFGFGQFMIGWTAVSQFAFAIYFGMGQFTTGITAIGQFAYGKYVLAQMGIGKYVWSDASSQWFDDPGPPDGSLFTLEETEDGWEPNPLPYEPQKSHFIVSFGEDASRELYVLTMDTVALDTNGVVYRMEPA